MLALLPLVAACAQSRLAEVDGTELVLDGTMPELDAGIDMFTRPPRVYPPLNDPSVGADETSVPLCEFPDVNVLGPLGAACSGMDNPCGRGIRQPEGCCRLEPRYRGTACGDGLMCDDWGACVPRTGDPPMEANGVVGTVGWIDARPESGSLFHVDPRGARFNFGHDPAVELVPTADEVIGLEEVHLVNGRYYGVEAFAVVAPTVTRRFYFPETTTEACVVVGDVDSMAPMRGDCTSPGTIHVACPSTGPINCEIFEGYGARVTGNNIGLAWIPGGALADVTDLRRALIGPAMLGLHTSTPIALRFAPTALLPPNGDPLPPPPPPQQCSPSQCGQGITCVNCRGEVRPRACNFVTGSLAALAPKV